MKVAETLYITISNSIEFLPFLCTKLGDLQCH